MEVLLHKLQVPQPTPQIPLPKMPILLRHKVVHRPESSVLDVNILPHTLFFKFAYNWIFSSYVFVRRPLACNLKFCSPPTQSIIMSIPDDERIDYSDIEAKLVSIRIGSNNGNNTVA